MVKHGSGKRISEKCIIMLWRRVKMTQSENVANQILEWYSGFDNGFYCFQTGNYLIGFKEMKCKQEGLTIANLALMVKLNMTRV